ncbi:inner nuclear membrane protein heh2-related [Anaeramoeba flamelloides]|uniref:Inner nuclear membrane protein heh2-related n=1 Tax=Anaeramoeba flamelloides TaxID=1746091 RepID=A0ABQ8X8Q0_9EUKA|nr:inner nuclear membrane protein heh2-related [Anaeramoeba flamelloides]
MSKKKSHQSGIQSKTNDERTILNNTEDFNSKKQKLLTMNSPQTKKQNNNKRKTKRRQRATKLKRKTKQKQEDKIGMNFQILKKNEQDTKSKKQMFPIPNNIDRKRSLKTHQTNGQTEEKIEKNNKKTILPIQKKRRVNFAIKKETNTQQINKKTQNQETPNKNITKYEKEKEKENKKENKKEKEKKNKVNKKDKEKVKEQADCFSGKGMNNPNIQSVSYNYDNYNRDIENKKSQHLSPIRRNNNADQIKNNLSFENDILLKNIKEEEEEEEIVDPDHDANTSSDTDPSETLILSNFQPILKNANKNINKQTITYTQSFVSSVHKKEKMSSWIQFYLIAFFIIVIIALLLLFKDWMK